MTRAHALLVGALALSCTSRVVAPVSEDTGGADSSTGVGVVETSTSPASTTFPPASTSDGGSTAAGTDDPAGGMTFIEARDGGGLGRWCSIFAQDCPPGEKCMPYANDGGPAWNATGCFPIARDPVGYGETCQVEGNGASGLDDCDAGMMCWHVNRDGFGECVHMCIGGWKDPTCPLPDQHCPISAEGVLLICRPNCDPLAQDCAYDDEVCYPLQDEWGCAPDASGDGGTFGDPCEFTNACDPMHVCLGAAALPGCEGSVGCCSQICDVLDETSDAACAALAAGTACEAWYLEGQAPTGYEHVGVCAVPQ